MYKTADTVYYVYMTQTETLFREALNLARRNPTPPVVRRCERLRRQLREERAR